MPSSQPPTINFGPKRSPKFLNYPDNQHAVPIQRYYLRLLYRLCLAIFQNLSNFKICLIEADASCKLFKQFAACISFNKKLKDQSGAPHSPFFAILHHKSFEWKIYCFSAILFSLHIQNQKGPKISFSEPRLCL